MRVLPLSLYQGVQYRDDTRIRLDNGQDDDSSALGTTISVRGPRRGCSRRATSRGRAGESIRKDDARTGISAIQRWRLEAGEI